jgi:hypothetical protein
MHAILLLAALGAGPDLAGHDSLLLQSAAVPVAGAARVGVTGGGNTAAGLLGAFGIWSVGSTFAAEVGAHNESGKVSPTVGLRWQALFQEDAGIDLTAATRFKSVGFRGDGSEVELVASAGRTLGSLSLAANAVAGKGVSEGDGGVDVEGGLSARLALGRAWWVGAEGRYRRGFEPAGETRAAPGRSYDLTAGPNAGVSVGIVRAEALVGIGVPQGTAPAGPCGLVSVSVDF